MKTKRLSYNKRIRELDTFILQWLVKNGSHYPYYSKKLVQENLAPSLVLALVEKFALNEKVFAIRNGGPLLLSTVQDFCIEVMRARKYDLVIAELSRVYERNFGEKPSIDAQLSGRHLVLMHHYACRKCEFNKKAEQREMRNQAKTIASIAHFVCN